MDTELIRDKFIELGARVFFGEITGTPNPNREAINIRINILNDTHGPYFKIETREDVDISVPDVQKVDRHLLLFSRDPELQRFLCGHDERNWFVAAIPEDSGASNVKEAKEALKPGEVEQSQKGAKVKTKDLKKRKTGAYLRQGEWFFIPKPNTVIDESLILKNEPIQRGRATQHIVEEVFRIGGQTIYICPKFPEGLSERQHKEILKSEPELNKVSWQVRTVSAKVYGRGRVTHQDHKTIVLPFWHEILMNTETHARAMRNVLFVD